MPQRTMTVRDLIANLQRFEPSWPVLCQDDAALRSPQFVTEGTDTELVEGEQRGHRECREFPVVLIF